LQPALITVQLVWPFHKRARILLLTAYDAGFVDIASLSIPRMMRYAKRHNLSFRAVTDSASERPGSWIKVPPIRAALNEKFDYVWWIDADALLLRDDIDIRSAIIPTADLLLSWLGPETTDWHGPPELPGHFNAGVMLIRVGSWARDFLKLIWEETNSHQWADQASILHHLGYDNLLGLGVENPLSVHRKHLGYLDPAWNSVPGVAMTEDPIVYHYAGLPNRDRVRLMQADASTPMSADISSRRQRARHINRLVKEARFEAVTAPAPRPNLPSFHHNGNVGCKG
jgi:galactosyl transferase GMA12/MNN10 family